ncbi:MAG: hypothetical protein ACO3JL_05010 [Myxococcota bacterium]
MPARNFLPFLLLASLAAATGCEGCADEPAGSEGDDRDTLPTEVTEPTPEEKPLENRTLAFQGTAPVVVFYGQQVQLSFKLTTVSGQLVTGEPVSFTLEGQGGSLSTQSAVTDASGLAKVTFTAGTADATPTVRASAELASDVTVALQVKVNPIGQLKVTVTSTTRIPTASAEVLVFRGPATNVPTCSYLESTAAVPSATFSADFPTLPSSRTFNDQPHGEAVTIYASGFNAAGDLIGTGCVDGSAIVGGQTVNVSVSIAQLPSILEGDYDVLMAVDLGGALPEPYETYVDTTTAILSDPAGFVVYQALKSYDPTWWFKDLDNDGIEEEYSYREVSENPSDWPSFQATQPVIDTLLSNQLGSRYDTITTVGGDLRSAILSFEVGSRFTFEPVAGSEGLYEVTEQWNDMVFTWNLGCETDPSPAGCARRSVQLEDTDYAFVSTTYAATAEHAPIAAVPASGNVSATPGVSERFEIVAAEHQMALQYGAIIMVAFEYVIFPSLAGEPGPLTLSEFFQSIIDCAAVGQSLANNLGWLPVNASTYQGACNLGLNFAGEYVTGQALELSVGDQDAALGVKEQTGVLGSGMMYLIDQDRNLSTELVRELEMQVQWNNAETGVNTDITAPITGEGRETADGCNADAACSGGTTCQPIAHYLKVQAAEMTCKKAVGDIAGQGDCLLDNECGSGLCVGAVPAAGGALAIPGTCFEACTTDAACGTGSVCQDALAFYNLDDGMSGRGDAELSTCAVAD